MSCSVGSAAERPEGSHIVSTSSLVLVPMDRDVIPPTDTHGRAAVWLRVWLPDADDGRVETRDTVEFVHPRGNFARPACAAACATPEWGEAKSCGYRVGEGFGGPPAHGVAVATCASW